MRVSVWATKKPPSHPRLTRELTTPASSDPSAQAPEKDGAKPKAKKDKGEKKPSAPAADFDAFEEAKTVIIVPANQLELTQKEMDEEITKQLTANNPNAPANIARYNTKEREYKFEPMIDQLVMHFASDGYLLHRDSDAAKQQLQLEAMEAEAIEEYERAVAGLPKKRAPGEEGEGGEGGDDGGDAADDDDDAAAREPVDDSKALRNQFNFSERAAQTVNNPTRERQSATEPPPSQQFTASATQWEMYDAYMEDQLRVAIQRDMMKKQKQREKEAEEAAEAGEPPPKKKEEPKPPPKEKKPEMMAGVPMTRAVKVMERMVNQNSYDDIAQDFKYWEDQSDRFREGEGTLLPLWKFYNERAKRRHVTAIAWNPTYNDLFAVGYGSFDFVKQMSGLICCYSLKNPSHPEYTFTTDSGVMCLDFHPHHPSLLAVGLYDGSVMVYDVRNKVNRPIRQCTVKTGKHTDPVWQVKWQDQDLSERSLNFCSVSSDGRVTTWTMSKSELVHEDLMELKLVTADADDDADALGSLAGGCCFDFNKAQDHLFVVGTEEGHVHKCSKAYNSQYLETYVGHNMAVYSVQWNPFHQKAFLSASADWSVKLWEHNSSRPLMSFDLNNAVGDVAWSPLNSTSFAAVTSDGKVHVYDLDVNKHEPICEQKIVRKAKLTKVAFNPEHPVLLVGDDRGCVTCLKLSPNLRKGGAEPERMETLVDTALKGEQA